MEVYGKTGFTCQILLNEKLSRNISIPLRRDKCIWHNNSLKLKEESWANEVKGKDSASGIRSSKWT